MTVTLDLTGTGKWERAYYHVLNSDPENVKILKKNKRAKIPYINPLEIPLLFDKHILAVMAQNSQTPSTWKKAGDLVQVFTGVFHDEPNFDPPLIPTFGVDVESKYIPLNTLRMYVFSSYAPQFYLWFEPVKWLKKVTLTIWKFVGEQFDSTEEILETIKVDLAVVQYQNGDVKHQLDRIESKVDEMYLPPP